VAHPVTSFSRTVLRIAFIRFVRSAGGAFSAAMMVSYMPFMS
jgi:hypothetical protein